MLEPIKDYLGGIWNMSQRKRNIQPEPFRIRMVEPICLPSPEQREEALKRGNYNMFSMHSEDIYIDLLTDSGTGAMSKYQWGALMCGDESYAGATSFSVLSETVKDVLGFDYTIPTHQGRAAENVAFSALMKEGDIIPFNQPFDTTRGHIFRLGAEPIDCLPDEAYDPTTLLPFKGNVDIGKLRAAIEKYGLARIPMIMVTITNNSGGGQPVSLQNLRETAAIAKEFDIPLFLDAARMAENAYFIKMREEACADMSLGEILRACMDCADAITVSAKKDPLVNIGGLVCCRSEEMYTKILPNVIMFEGFATYGGLAGRDLETLAVGLREMLDEEYMSHRIAQVRYLGEMLEEDGVPFMKPAGGHAIFLDAKAFFPHIPQSLYPADVLTVELYREGAIRGIGLGALAFETKDEKTGAMVYPKLELARLAINRRSYTNCHMEYVADKVADVYKRRESVDYGLEVFQAPGAKGLHHFLAKMRPVKL